MRAVRSAFWLVTGNGTELRLARFFSTASREQATARHDTRRPADGRSSIIAQVFKKESPYGTSERGHFDQLRTRDTLGLLHNSKSHMSAPVVSGKSHCLGVLSLETGERNRYEALHVHALALLAAHASRAILRAVDHELAEVRAEDLETVGRMVGAFDECANREQIRKTLINCLKRVHYRRGLICEVRFQGGKVVCRDSWGSREMKELCGCVAQYFRHNGNIGHIALAKRRYPQILNVAPNARPSRDDDVHIARLGAIAMIPHYDPQADIVWVLHVEREDTAPIGKSDLPTLSQMCHAAMSADARLERQADERRVADIALRWSAILNQGFVRQNDAFRELAEFAVRKLCTRCRIYKIDGNSQAGLYSAGPPLSKIKEFGGFPLPSESGIELDALKRERRAILVCAGKAGANDPTHRGEFPIIRVWPVPKERALSKEGLPEWVELPLFLDGELVAKAVFDKQSTIRGVHEKTFSLRELRVIAQLGRLTSLGAGRIAQTESLLRDAIIGTCTGVMRHAMNRAIWNIGEAKEDVDKEMRRKSLPRPVSKFMGIVYSQVRHATEIATFFRQVQIQREREFDREDQKRVSRDRPSFITVSKEIERAISLSQAGHVVDELVAGGDVLVRRGYRPLCLILLVLLENASDSLNRGDNRRNNSGRIRVIFSRGRHRHSLLVSNGGAGIDKDVADKLRTGNLKALQYRTVGRGLGLSYAMELAKLNGWKLALVRRKDPTKFRLLMPSITREEEL